MCERSDFDWMKLTPMCRQWLDEELDEWHRDYRVPDNGVVLDVGAGCGETAWFYLQHGAKQVICVERFKPAFGMLCRNLAPWISTGVIVPILADIDQIKCDIEGAEMNMDLEVHFPHAWEWRNSKNLGTINQYRLIHL